MKIKKLVLSCIIATFFVQFCMGAVCAQETTRINEISLTTGKGIGTEDFDLEIRENSLKTEFIAYNVDGSIDLSEYNKITKKVYLNGVEVSYSYVDGESDVDSISPFASIQINSPEAWMPVNVTTGIKINFAPLIDFAGNVATQLLLAHTGVTASSLLTKLVSSVLSSHWKIVINAIGSTLAGYAGGWAASKIVNVTFNYDLQRTKGLVYMSGGYVPVTGYRYANYRATLTVLGRSVYKNSGKMGGWWSSSKPYSL